MVNKQKPRADIVHPSATPEDLSLWQLPVVDDPQQQELAEKTNAMGLKKTWRYEPPDEQEVEEPQPLTAEEIEAIRQAAYDEGFNQGKEQGFATGYDEGKAQGTEQGLEQGQQQGLEQGLAQAQQQIEALNEQWSDLIKQLHQPLAVVEKNIEAQLLELVLQLTSAVVHHEAKTNPDILMSAISAGIKALPSQQAQTQIYLHPDDIKLVEQAFGEQHIQESGWRLLPAPQLQRGGCQVENATSNIDLRVKTRLKEVLESFLHDALHQ